MSSASSSSYEFHGPASYHQPDIANAVNVSDVVLRYGISSTILNGVNLQIPYGSIYSLLGPSGCGKTSIIRCIMGLLRPTSGRVSVFGKQPGDRDSHVPGFYVGYMPQESSLFLDLTITETLRHFGLLFNLPELLIEERSEFLQSLLNLPELGALVRVLSGGQKRRLSLACALIHKPPLLILDEPTVGVDPILRQNIWRHLVELGKRDRLTVLITTHYIEEAKDSDFVGLMRKGKVMVQSNPQTLMKQFHYDTLEAVFLHLCQMQSKKTEPIMTTIQQQKQQLMMTPSQKQIHHLPQEQPTTQKVGSVEGNDFELVSLTSRSNSPGSEHTYVNLSAQPPCSSTTNVLVEPTLTITSSDSSYTTNTTSSLPDYVHNLPRPQPSFWRPLWAMILKDYLSLSRNIAYILFQFCLPALEVILFCVCIGGNLHSIPVAVHNSDEGSMFTESMFEEFDHDAVIFEEIDRPEDAFYAVQHGIATTAMMIPTNFTDALMKRLGSMKNISKDVLHQSTIQLHSDFTDQITALTVYRKTVETFLSVGKDFLLDMGENPAMLEFPVNVSEPIYGSTEDTYTEFMTPGVVLSIGFLAAVPLTAMAMVTDRRNGLIERTMVTGVSMLKFLLSVIISQFLILVVQVSFVLFFVFCVFQISYHGHFLLIFMLAIMQSLCGMCFGLLVSSVSTNETFATMLALGSFYPNLLLSGTVWPLEGMNDGIRYFSYFLPQTCAIKAMRAVIGRGWGIERLEVQLGFLVTFIWLIVFLLGAMIVLKYKK